MPLTIAIVLNIIWQPLKKCVTKDATVVFDLPFKISTKYTTGLLVILICLSFAKEFVSSIAFDCTTKGVLKGSIDTNKELNDYCRYETFLVVKALDPHMRRDVSYPGVAGYKRGSDEVLRQRYYQDVWFILGQLCIIALLPYFFWKTRGVKKIKPLVTIDNLEEYSEEHQRLRDFLDTVGMNDSFAWFYVGCKIIATLSPLIQWYYLCLLIDKRYKYYGVEVINHLMDYTDPWPNPMDVLFPKFAKCELSSFGYSGHLEVKSALCKMPMNNITQWSFFIYWFWMAFVFFVNILSLFYLILHIFTCWRQYRYRKFIGVACRQDVEQLTNYFTTLEKNKLKHKKCEVIHIDMSFGDWLVLSFMKKNLPHWKFVTFIQLLVTDDNMVIQLKPVSIIVPTLSTLCIKEF